MVDSKPAWTGDMWFPQSCDKNITSPYPLGLPSTNSCVRVSFANSTNSADIWSNYKTTFPDVNLVETIKNCFGDINLAGERHG
jgi:hypothetical protein